VRPGQGAGRHGQAHRSCLVGATLFDPASLAEAKGHAEHEGPDRARHRRLARHRPRHRAGAGPARARVVGTATSEAGAAGISEALAPFGAKASCST
jgi:hypothetical protein